MENIKEVKKTFSLPDEWVTVKFIPRRKGMAAEVQDDHIIAGGMLQGARKKYSAPLQRNGAVANILTKEEKEYLEDITGYNLSVYGNFWNTFFVTLRKEDAENKFYLGDPRGYISIKILESLKNDIAPSWKDRNKRQTYQFVIVRDNEIFDEKKVQLDTKKEAFKIYGKIEDDKDKLIGVLKLLTNRPISEDSTLTWIQGQVEEYLDQMPSAFIDIVKDPEFDTKILINKGVDKGIIVRNGNKYSTVDGLELCEADEVPSFNNVVRYLDNPKHQDVRSLIEAKIDKA